jgi:hypothetical protein
MPMQDNFNITMDQLRIGLYIHLDLKWFDHPFSFSHFKIQNEAQIKTIQSLGLKSIRYDPVLSDFNPLPQKTQQIQQTQDEAKPDISPVLAAKVALVERIQRQREAAVRIENAFVHTAKTIQGIEKNLFTMPAETVRKARQLVDRKRPTQTHRTLYLILASSLFF